VNLHMWYHRALGHPHATWAAALLILATILALAAAKPLSKTLWRAVAAAALLLGLTIIWWIVNSPLEGPVLLTFSEGHGLTVGDLLGTPALALGFGLIVRAFMRRSKRRTAAPLAPGLTRVGSAAGQDHPF
jgi:hypothetical protein